MAQVLADEAGGLAALTQLTCLTLRPAPSGDTQRHLLANLTGLRALTLCGLSSNGPLGKVSVSCLWALTQLRSLALPRLALVLHGDTGGLERLASLTRLEVASLRLPWDPPEGQAPAMEGLPRFPLPPRLEALETFNTRLDVLLYGALVPPPGDSLHSVRLGAQSQTYSGEPGIRYLYEQRVVLYGPYMAHITPLVTAESRLTRAGEEALCNTFRLLALDTSPDSQEFGTGSQRLQVPKVTVVRYLAGSDVPPLLRPPLDDAGGGGGDGGGGGGGGGGSDGGGGRVGAPPPHHGIWLQALGGCGRARLRLERMSLGAEDFEAIASHLPHLEELELRCSLFTGAGLLTLARLPCLRILILDLSRWDMGLVTSHTAAGSHTAPGAMRPPPPPWPLGALPDLLSARRPGPWLEVRLQVGREPVPPCLQAWAADLDEALRAAGVEPLAVTARPFTFDADGLAEDWI
ncbi:hypothetical protein GPECTOR_9g583 [Gonium pectorale]|uniref:Uncharacterized protein n=1 Tax=Gonium pectorale TaxID=33097 RepID=A0A150GRS6_GONPE|nr:hypothetical protein GPECTOR_9g583 [Gonium pectorale]|eukprot:KXZ52539.1 hypothetical protein GPECTOR_9g583 [Gonium pectorale]